MGLLCGIAAVLLVTLLLVMLVGHGMWLLVAALFRIGKPSSKPQGAPEHFDRAQDLVRAEVQMVDLFRAKLITEETHREVMRAIAAARLQLMHRSDPPLPVLPLVDRHEVITAPAEPPPVEPTLPPPPVTTPIAAPAAFVAPAPEPDLPPQGPARRRRPLSEVFATFMEEKNIRWGELLGGLLIVGCSIALVLNFWAQINERPLFKFSLFTCVTIALFGLGLYTEHRWKLPTTSRGILLIAMLLVPLNFLAFAAFSRGVSAPVIAAAGELVALLVFALLARAAAKVLVPAWPGLMTVGLVGLCGSMIVTRYLGGALAEQTSASLYGFAALPLACYLAISAAILVTARPWQTVRAAAAEAIFLLLGVLTFATILAFGLVIRQTQASHWAIHHLAPLVSLAGIPSLATGLLLWSRVTDPRLGKTRTAGTAVAALGTCILLAGTALAWPDPSLMLPVALANFLVLTIVAARFQLPAVGYLAGPCLLLAYLLGFHVASHHMGWISSPVAVRTALAHPSGGAALLPLVLLVGGAGAWLRRRTRTAYAPVCFHLAAAFAGLSLTLITAGGFARRGDPYGAAWVYAIYAVGALVLAVILRRIALSWVGWALLLGAFVQFFVSHSVSAHPWATGMLAYSTTATIAAIALRRSVKAGRFLSEPARWIAGVATEGAGLILLFQLTLSVAGTMAPHFAWIGVIWVALSFETSSAALLAVGELSLALSLILWLTARLALRAWFQSAANPLLHPWTLQAYGVALTTFCVGVALLRSFARGRTKSLLVRASRMDQWMSATVAAGFALLVLFAAWPGIASELSLLQFDRSQFLAGAPQAAGWGSWLLLALLLCSMSIALRETHRAGWLLGLIALAWLVCPLLAARFAPTHASASALRWSAAAFLLSASIPLWMRDRLPAVLKGFVADSSQARVPAEFRSLLNTLTVLPILILTLYPASQTLMGGVIAGPAAGSFFHRIGDAASYVLPLALIATVFVGHAIRERSSRYALAASLVANLTVSLAYALSLATHGIALSGSGGIHLVRLVQMNALAAAMSAAIWCAAWRLSSRTEKAAPLPRLLRVLISFAVVLNVALIAPATLLLFLAPGARLPAAAMIGRPLGWVAVIATLAAVALTRSFRLARLTVSRVVIILIAASAMLALTSAPWDIRNWLQYHVLLFAHVASTAGTLVAGYWMLRRNVGRAEWIGDSALPSAPIAAEASASEGASPVLQYFRPGENAAKSNTLYVGGAELRSATTRATLALSVISVLLALRAMLGDPGAPWWSATALVIVSLLSTAIACWSAAPGFLYASTVLLNLAASFCLMDAPRRFGGTPLLELMAINAIALALPGIAWLVLHLQVFRRGQHEIVANRYPVHRFAAMSAVCLTGAAVVLSLLAHLDGQGGHLSPLLGWAAIASTALIMLASFWDCDARYAMSGLYAIGLAAIGMLLDRLHMESRWLIWAAALSLAGYTLLIGLLWNAREIPRRTFSRAGLPLPDAERSQPAWLESVNTLAALAVPATAFWADFTFMERWARLTLAAAGIAQAIALGLLSRGTRSLVLRQFALLCGIAGAVAFSWAWMPEGIGILDRCAVMVAVIMTMTACYVGALRGATALATLWADALRQAMPAFCLLSIAGLPFTLGAEIVAHVNDGRVAMRPASIAAVAIAFLAAIVATIAWALREENDPAKPVARRRDGFVYAAEALLALLFVHLRLTVPQLFHGMLSQYWPLVVMAIAFAGVGLGEWFRRRQQRVLAEPLERTGIFLPLLPVLGFWLSRPASLEYAEVLFAVGFFYGVLAMLRRSYGFGLLAALAGNGGLWSLLNRVEGLGFLQHPQLWMIPGALCVLAAVQLNLDRLSTERVRLIRYACLLVIYVSSTADVFLNGVRHAPWLPLVLAGLSVAGVLVGIMFRIRPFLYLGTTFLALAVLTMIGYAYADLHWTWIWYVAGILLGLLIIAVFALFEKKRAEVLAMVDGLKQWQ